MERIQFLSQVVGLITQFWAPKWMEREGSMTSFEEINDRIIEAAEDLWRKYDAMIGERPNIAPAMPIFNPHAGAFQKHN